MNKHPVPSMAATTAHPFRGDASVLAREPLEWRRRGWSRREWDLLANGQRVGGLVLRRSFREHAQLDGPSGTWAIRRHFWSGAIEVFFKDRPALRYESRPFTRDVVECAEGSRFEWGRPAWWKSDWDMSTESGFAVVSFRIRLAFRASGYTIEVSPMGRRLPELEPLILLGGYLLTRAHSHAH